MNRLHNNTLLALILACGPAAASAYQFPPGTLKWAFPTGDDVVASPTVGADGTVYIGSTDHKLYAINPNGTEKWSFETGSDVWGSVAIGADGALYFGSGDGYIYALNPDGSQRWAFAMADGTFSSPTIGADGTIYVGSLDRNLYAIAPDGSKRWSFATGGTISSSPAVGADGTVYVGSADGRFYALNPDGTLRWLHEASDWMDSPTLAPDGTIYVGSGDQSLYAFNPDGSVKWTFAARGSVWGSAALAADGTLYFGSAGNNLYALNPDGSAKWVLETGSWVNATPTVGPDGTVYAGSGDQNLYAVDPQGNVKWTFQTGDPVFSSPAIGPDGTLYLGTWSGWDHHVYAVHGDAPAQGRVWVSTEEGASFVVEHNGSTIHGEGYVPFPSGSQMRVHFAGEPSGDVLTAPLTHYIGPSTSGEAELSLVVDSFPVGTAELRLGSGGEATLTYRLDDFSQLFTGRSDEEVVAVVYSQLFGRVADAPGKAYWLGRLQTGESTRDSIMADVLAGAGGTDAEAAAATRLEERLTLRPSGG